MAISKFIQEAVADILKDSYGDAALAADVPVTETKPEFEGDYTVVLFALVKLLKKAPDALAKELGEKLVSSHPETFTSYNVIKGFLNLGITDRYWTNFLHEAVTHADYGQWPQQSKRVMVEYSSPNTNKPLHLGHLRNNFLGWSIAEILKASGADVIKTCIVNDRGVHICKSMIAWQKFSGGATPESTGKKGDHLVGDFYVAFENELKKQSAPLFEQLLAGDTSVAGVADRAKAQAIVSKLPQLTGEKLQEARSELQELARNHTPLMQEVRDMLLKWEQGDAETIALWKRMNSWVYAGFDETYNRIGSDFHKIYYESDTYLLGKSYVEEGLAKGLFSKKEDGSVWIDLTADGLDEKLVLRKDGTSVYITQDLGLAKKKSDDFAMDESIYVVGDEQNYHMKVLALICKKLGIPHAEGIHHLSYGMVELPSGRMKSREGTVVDADDLVTEMEQVSEKHTLELGKVKDFTKEELRELYTTLGLGALKFFLLRVDPKKRMIFNPEESIDFHGFTGPFIQYTYARTRSILRKEQPSFAPYTGELLSPEKQVVIELEKFPQVIGQAAAELNPSIIAGYVFRLAQTFNSFITELRVLTAETPEKKELRLQLCHAAAEVIRKSMHLLGIRVPERM